MWLADQCPPPLIDQHSDFPSAHTQGTHRGATSAALAALDIIMGEPTGQLCWS